MEPFDLTDGVIVLRIPDEQDVDAVFAICQDPLIQEWTTVPSPYSREDAVGFVTGFVPTGWAERTALTWAIHEAEGDRLVGMTGIMLQEGASGEIGYWVAPEARRRGYAARATELMIDAAFGRLDLTRLEWRAYAGNWGSRAVAEGAGFRFEGEIRGGALQRGVRRDDWVATLLRDDPRPGAPDAA